MDLLTEHRREHIKEMIESGFYPSKERFIELCDGTYSRKEICDMLGISTSTFKILRRYFELPPKKRKIDTSTYANRGEKIRETFIKKYGVKNCSMIPEIRDKMNKTFHEKYGDIDGEPYKNMIKKRFETLSSNGKDAVLSSSQQRYIRDLFNGELNYLFVYYHIDVYLKDKNIGIEYSGSGHDLSVQLGRETRERFEGKEKRRKTYCINHNLPIIEFVSKTDKLPQDEILIEYVEDFYQKTLKDGTMYVCVDLDSLGIKEII